MNARQRLPNRRLQVTDKIEVGGQSYFVSIGFRDTTWEPGEVFITGPKDGSQLGVIVQDAALLISLALQWGVPADALAAAVARLPDAGHPAASVIGAAIDLVKGHIPQPAS